MINIKLKYSLVIIITVLASMITVMFWTTSTVNTNQVMEQHTDIPLAIDEELPLAKPEVSVLDPRSAEMPQRYVNVIPAPSALPELSTAQLNTLKTKASSKQIEIESLLLEFNENLGEAEERKLVKAKINQLKKQYNALILPVIMHEMNQSNSE